MYPNSIKFIRSVTSFPKLQSVSQKIIAEQSFQVTAMVSELWGKAVKAAKDYYLECQSKNVKIGRKALEKWLEGLGFDPHTAQNASETVCQYFASISQYDHPETGLEASSTGLVKESSSGGHSFSCTMAFFPKDLAEKTIEIAMNISDSSLYDPKDEKQKYGREIEPHITVKYGTHTEDPEDIKEALKELGSIHAKLGRISFFTTNEKYDVVKVDVISEDLEKANKLISEKCKNTDSYPDYIPHATIAYVKKGTCEYLDGNKDLDGIEIVFKELAFHDKDGNKTIIHLNEEKVEKKASSIHPLDEKNEKEWFGIKLDAGNYHQLVRNQLTSIIEDVWKVSEKDFKRVDKVVETSNRICRGQKAGEIIGKSESDKERPRLCAERIYCMLKDEIKEEQ